MKATFIIVIMGLNRIGVVLNVCDTLSPLQGNIEGIKQVSLQNDFCMILKVTFPTSIQQKDIEQAIKKAGSLEYLSFMVREWENPDDTDDLERGESVALMVTGENRPGILRDITECLVNHKINIIDFVGIVDVGVVAEERFELILLTNIPAKIKTSDVKKQLKDTLGHKFSIHFQHQEIVNAANEIFWRHKT